MSETLLYCGKCNLRRYFRDGKCEMCEAHAAEQPKLTEEQVQEIRNDWFYSVDRVRGVSESQFIANRVNNLLLTSPVAPPPPTGRGWTGTCCENGNLGEPHICMKQRGDLPPNISELRGLLLSLDRLLSDPHPGLMTWREQYKKASEAILEFYEVNLPTISPLITGIGGPPIAPGEQPPQACPSCERAYATLCTKCHNCSDCCGCLLTPHLHAPAPPAQERASAKSTLVQIMVGNTWEQSVAAFERALATAAKQAREEAFEEADKLAEKLGLAYLDKGNKVGWSICDDIGHEIRALAPHPSPQDPE